MSLWAVCVQSHNSKGKISHYIIYYWEEWSLCHSLSQNKHVINHFPHRWATYLLTLTFLTGGLTYEQFAVVWFWLFSGGVREETAGLLVSALSAVPLWEEARYLFQWWEDLCPVQVLLCLILYSKQLIILTLITKVSGDFPPVLTDSIYMCMVKFHRGKLTTRTDKHHSLWLKQCVFVSKVKSCPLRQASAVARVPPLLRA